MQPTQKSEPINSFASELIGRGRVESIKGNICTMCGEFAVGFNDALSEREYTISGMCQDCQDSMYNVMEDDCD
jgi:hypothetical protein